MSCATQTGTYTRTLDKFGEPTLFGTQTLTREQWALVPGDLVAALGGGSAMSCPTF
jgi:hypothetical protein